MQPIEKRTLGTNGPAVSAISLRAMGMPAFYGTRNDQESNWQWLP